jgi:hypothetical protein
MKPNSPMEIALPTTGPPVAASPPADIHITRSFVGPELIDGSLIPKQSKPGR